jgi:hypothetical protein
MIHKEMGSDSAACSSEESIIDNEEWKTITGFRNYSVSNLGQVRNNKTGRILKVLPDKDGYNRVHLGQGNTSKVHRLVLQEFIGPIPEGMAAEHLNHIRDDNRLSNLRIATHSENHRNKTSYFGHRVEYVDELSENAEALSTHNGHQIDEGFWIDGDEVFRFVAGKFRRLTKRRKGCKLWVNITNADGSQVNVSIDA